MTMVMVALVHRTFAARSATLNGAKKQFESLLKWAVSHGAELSQKVGYNTSCYGGEPSIQYFAKKNIKKGELILQVPKKIQFRIDQNDDAVWKIINEKTSARFIEHIKKQPQVVMAMKMLMEEKLDTVSPQISFFPSKPPSVMYFDEATLERSTHKTLKRHVLDRKLVLKNIWTWIRAELVPHLPPNTRENFTMENFLRAWIIISSRSHGYFAKPTKSIAADSFGRKALSWQEKFFSVVPLADLLNHDSAVCDFTLKNIKSMNTSNIFGKKLCNQQRDVALQV